MRSTFLALCLFLFAYKATSYAIVDTDGQLVSNQAGAYYLVPDSNDLSGSIGLATVGNDSFPQTVVLDTLANGIPVRFTSPILLPFIRSQMLLHIRFVSSATELGWWKVEEEFPIGWTVKVSENSPSFMGPFSIQPAKTGYKFVYYPEISEEGDNGEEIGLVYTGSHYRLVVKDGDPFIFKIKKATESSAGIKSIT
ncbi:hypothetical protein L6164_033230 [Bauhinia variegata]|uniref:Uncharacterized protein n=1 Tax=Bauhinia variegata TaxID=167791 RepID=A0ACB9KRM5_BAUVA|nr:hypothetical protein L6164_033230 [Bauhinia variegata]